jgi:hypothetical protein
MSAKRGILGAEAIPFLPDAIELIAELCGSTSALLRTGKIDDGALELLGPRVPFSQDFGNATLAQPPTDGECAQHGDDDDDEGNRIQQRAPMERSTNLPPKTWVNKVWNLRLGASAFT